MRPSKSRSRGKTRSNNRSPANNLNRVFDSSGPEGKVRGTPQQIIDKYSQLARDASLGNDRVAAVNFQQHAEHYTRLLAEAQRDAEEKRLQTEQQNRDRQQQQQKPRDRDDRSRDEGDDRGRDEGNPQGDVKDASADVIDSGEEADSGLVETPEAKPRRAPRSRKPRAAPKSDSNEAQGSGESARGDASEAAE
jgi:hypothetical protein